MKTALFVSYGGGHIAMVLPVVQALKKRNPELNCVVLALTTGYAKAKLAGVSPLGYKDFVADIGADEVRHWGRLLYPGNTSPDVSEEESIAYLGINYLDLIQQLGASQAAQCYARHGRYGFLPIHFMHRLMDTVQPDIVISTNSPRSERAALEAAVQRRIPTVGMVDLFAQPGDNFVTRPTRPDWTCVLSQTVRHRLIDKGFLPDRVIATGNPAFDGLLQHNNQVAAQSFLQDHNWQNQSVVLWAGHQEPPSPGTNDSFGTHSFALSIETKLREFVKTRPHTALVVRYHPGQWHTFPRLPDQERVHFSVPSVEPIHPIILASKIVVVQNSTVGLESAMAGRHVVSLEHSQDVQSSFSLAALGVTTPCHSTSSLPDLLDEILPKPAVAPLEYCCDGQAAQRVARLIEDVLHIHATPDRQ